MKYQEIKLSPTYHINAAIKMLELIRTAHENMIDAGLNKEGSIRIIKEQLDSYLEAVSTGGVQ